MNPLDIRTVFVGSLVSSALCLSVMTLLWVQNRTRTPEVRFWLYDYIMQFVAFVLIVMRGVVPDVLSIVVANVLVIAGTILLLIGLQRYLGRESRQWYNYLMLAVFTLVHIYFTFVHPSLSARNVNASAGLIFLSVQAAWLMLRHAKPELRPANMVVGLVFIAISAVAAARVVADLITPVTGDLFRASTSFDTLVVLAEQMLFIGLTFALLLLMTRRLFSAVEHDMIVRQDAEEALRRSEEKFRVAFETVPDAILITRLSDGTIIEANDGYEAMTGFSKEESLGKTTLELGLWANVVDRELFVGKLVSHGRASELESIVRRKSGDTFPAMLFGEVIELDGESSIFTVFEDATDRKIAEEQLRELSNHDALTGLLNYRAFYYEGARRIAVAADSWIALIFIDLDGLKRINDEFGHLAGDQALLAYAEVLREGFRESDLIGRLGGDEFAILAVSRERVPDDAFLARYRAHLTARNETGTLPFAISASVGMIWRAPADETGLEELVGVADTRMYEVKRKR